MTTQKNKRLKWMAVALCVAILIAIASHVAVTLKKRSTPYVMAAGMNSNTSTAPTFLPTPEVYRRYAETAQGHTQSTRPHMDPPPPPRTPTFPRLTWSPPDANLYGFSAGLHDGPPWSAMYNDLQRVVVDGWTVLSELLHMLAGLRPLLVALTGSGAAVFALLESRQMAADAAARLSLPCRVHVGSTLPRQRARPLVRAERLI